MCSLPEELRLIEPKNPLRKEFRLKDKEKGPRQWDMQGEEIQAALEDHGAGHAEEFQEWYNDFVLLYKKYGIARLRELKKYLSNKAEKLEIARDDAFDDFRLHMYLWFKAKIVIDENNLEAMLGHFENPRYEELCRRGEGERLIEELSAERIRSGDDFFELAYTYSYVQARLEAVRQVMWRCGVIGDERFFGDYTMDEREAVLKTGSREHTDRDGDYLEAALKLQNRKADSFGNDSPMAFFDAMSKHVQKPNGETVGKRAVYNWAVKKGYRTKYKPETLSEVRTRIEADAKDFLDDDSTDGRYGDDKL